MSAVQRDELSDVTSGLLRAISMHRTSAYGVATAIVGELTAYATIEGSTGDGGNANGTVGARFDVPDLALALTPMMYLTRMNAFQCLNNKLQCDILTDIIMLILGQQLLEAINRMQHTPCTVYI
jgi:hypothetical protein